MFKLIPSDASSRKGNTMSEPNQSNEGTTTNNRWESQTRRLRCIPDMSFFLTCLFFTFLAKGLCLADDDSVPAPVVKTVMVDGKERTFHMLLPPDFDANETYWLMVTAFGRVERYWPLLKETELRAILVSPSFQFENVPRYYMAFPSLGEGEAILKIVEHLRASYRLQSKFLLTGFSGGANFAHRFAFQHPDVVLACAPYAAGSWSTPDERFLVKGVGEVRNATTYANGEPIPEERRRGREHYLNEGAVTAGKQKPLAGANKVPFLVMCGTEDTERLQNAKDFAQSLTAAGFRVETAWPKARHNVTVDVERQVVEFFKKVVDSRAESRTADDADSAAEATLKDLGFNINRNADGEVMIINNGHEDNGRSFEHELGLLSKLRWSKARGSAELPFSGSGWRTPGLNINNVPKSKDGLAHLMELKHLRSLYLERNENIRDDWLLQLEGMRQLEWFALHMTPNITNDGLKHLTGMDNLEQLVINETKITDDGLAHLKTLSNLKRLWLYGNQITGTGIPHLKTLDGLELLYLARTKITDANLRHLRELPSLRRLGLLGTNVSDLTHVGMLENLVVLRIGWTKVDNQTLKQLSRLAKLEELWLQGTNITDEGLVHLKRLTSLRRLYLSDTKISDEGLVHLKDSKNLTHLDIGETSVTDNAADELKKTLPNCKIVHRPPFPQNRWHPE